MSWLMFNGFTHTRPSVETKFCTQSQSRDICSIDWIKCYSSNVQWSPWMKKFNVPWKKITTLLLNMLPVGMYRHETLGLFLARNSGFLVWISKNSTRHSIRRLVTDIYYEKYVDFNWILYGNPRLIKSLGLDSCLVARLKHFSILFDKDSVAPYVLRFILSSIVLCLSLFLLEFCLKSLNPFSTGSHQK